MDIRLSDKEIEDLATKAGRMSQAAATNAAAHPGLIGPIATGLAVGIFFTLIDREDRDYYEAQRSRAENAPATTTTSDSAETLVQKHTAE